jgi:hypothetical protein
MATSKRWVGNFNGTSFAKNKQDLRGCFKQPNLEIPMFGFSTGEVRLLIINEMPQSRKAGSGFADPSATGYVRRASRMPQSGKAAAGAYCTARSYCAARVFCAAVACCAARANCTARANCAARVCCAARACWGVLQGLIVPQGLIVVPRELVVLQGL